jgi:hypothetical protein
MIINVALCSNPRCQWFGITKECIKLNPDDLSVKNEKDIYKCPKCGAIVFTRLISD